MYTITAQSRRSGNVTVQMPHKKKHEMKLIHDLKVLTSIVLLKNYDIGTFDLVCDWCLPIYIYTFYHFSFL